MALLGQAALAMWWDIAPATRTGFQDWHTHEHFPERLALPGFNRAARWASSDGGEGFFVLYELQAHEVLASPAYLASLNAPTPWSSQLMPHHRNMVRCQCRVEESRGSGLARFALTLRLGPAPSREHELRVALGELAATLPARQGLAGAHFLRTDTPQTGRTTEQRIRGDRDQTAEWIFVVTGYAEDGLRALAAGALSAGSLQKAGAAPGTWHGLYTLDASMLAGELQPRG